jgi:alpha-D-ribose 1-methylphosphonate 5-triphosphate synthase subunit PhnL
MFHARGPSPSAASTILRNPLSSSYTDILQVPIQHSELELQVIDQPAKLIEARAKLTIGWKTPMVIVACCVFGMLALCSAPTCNKTDSN